MSQADKSSIVPMNKARRLDIWDRLDFIAGQCLRLRDGSGGLLRKGARHEYIDHMIDLRDRLKQVSEIIEETIEVDA